PRGEVRGPFIALMHHPELARRLQQLGEQLRWGSKLPARLVELAVLITARRWTCQHEWAIHEKLARKAGLDCATVEAIAEGREPAGLPPEEAAVYAFCREAHAGGRHARSAVADDFFRGAITEHSAKFVPEELRFLENSLRAQVVVAEAVLRPGDAAGDRVDRLVLAAKPCRRPRVEKQQLSGLLLHQGDGHRLNG